MTQGPQVTCLRKASLTLVASLIPGLAGAVEHRYEITVNESLSRLSVEAQFSEQVYRIRAGSRRAEGYLSNARECGSGDRLRTDGSLLDLPADGIRCLTYDVDLGQAAADERRNRDLDSGNIMVSPSRWMWRPELDGRTTIRAHFVLPDGMRVSLPWGAVDGQPSTFLLGASPESASAPAIFGRFDYREIEIRGAVLRVALPDSGARYDVDKILAWLEATATDVALMYGRFPNPSPLVVVMPRRGGFSWRSTSPVPFGRVTRNGGEAVELFVNPDRPLSEFLDDWTATHEFSHLGVPYLNSRARWVSEGFAQYYQNILLARSGAYDEERAWQKLWTGLDRGSKSMPDFSPNAVASERNRGGRMKLYWSGAALALLADVEWRRRSDGEESLDLALDRLQDCCLPGTTVWTGREFVTRLDELVGGEPVITPLFDAMADSPGFPEFATTLEQLGVIIDGEDVRIREGAPLSDLRKSLTRQDAATAAWRRSLDAAESD